MRTLSTTAWIAHNLSLATSIGGALFGQHAFQPALEGHINDNHERSEVSDDAWSRFSKWNLAAHGIVAATWFLGRSRLSGREVSGKARSLTRAKDLLVLGSLVTGVATMIIGKVLAKKVQANPQASDGAVSRLRGAVRIANTANLLANTGTSALTTELAMEGSRSLRFGAVSRLLP